MTLEEKAKAYDETLEKAKAHINSKGIGDTVDLCKHLFPELRESEDERIRKALVWHLKAGEDFVSNGVTKEECIAYLEKQKEQKPVEWTELTWKDIVELEGIINNVHYDFSAGIGQESFGKEVLERFRNKKDDAEVDACEQKPAWSEEDEEILDDIINTLDRLGYAEFCKSSREEDIEEERFYYKEIQFLKRLKSLRYQPKQKWSEEDESCWNLIWDILDGSFTASKEGYKKAAAWFLKNCPKGTKSLRPQPREEIYQSAKHDLAIKFMNYLDENRPEGKMSLSNGECEDIDKAFKENDWAKIMKYIEKYHPSWKPSEHQMNIVKAVKEYVGRGSGYWGEGLRSLIEDLEKLI